MRERFIGGHDTEFFDYSSIDNDEELDDPAIEDVDAEERWFDDDDGYT